MNWHAIYTHAAAQGDPPTCEPISGFRPLRPSVVPSNSRSRPGDSLREEDPVGVLAAAAATLDRPPRSSCSFTDGHAPETTDSIEYGASTQPWAPWRRARSAEWVQHAQIGDCLEVEHVARRQLVAPVTQMPAICASAKLIGRPADSAATSTCAVASAAAMS